MSWETRRDLHCNGLALAIVLSWGYREARTEGGSPGEDGSGWVRVVAMETGRSRRIWVHAEGGVDRVYSVDQIWDVRERKGLKITTRFLA